MCCKSHLVSGGDKSSGGGRTLSVDYVEPKVPIKENMVIYLLFSLHHNNVQNGNQCANMDYAQVS